MFYLIIRCLGIFLFKVLFRLQVLGRENIPCQGGFILAANHTSYLDPPALGVACPRILCFLAKEELFAPALFGRFISALNAFPLKTGASDIRALRWAVRRLEAGQGVTIFPEGGRRAEGELVEPLQGIGFLAAKVNVPIVPAFIAGANLAMPIDSNFIRPKKIKVYFGRPLRAQEIPVGNHRNYYQTIARRVMQEIRKLRERGEQSQ